MLLEEDIAYNIVSCKDIKTAQKLLLDYRDRCERIMLQRLVLFLIETGKESARSQVEKFKKIVRTIQTNRKRKIMA